MPCSRGSNRLLGVFIFTFLIQITSSFITATCLPENRPTFLRPTKIMSAATIDSSVEASSSSSTATTTPSNWRVIPQDFSNSNSSKDIFTSRGIWDDKSYRDALQLYHRLMECQDSYVAGPIVSALKCLDHAFRLYGPESVICSFNGGKDAVVILHLVRAAHANYYHTNRRPSKQQQQQQQQQQVIRRPRVIYFDHADEFPEIQSFLRETVQQYDLEMLAFAQGTKFAAGLEMLVQHNYPTELLDHPVAGAAASADDYDLPTFPMAFVLGTRTTDPNAGQQGQFAPSSHYMPPFMRVNPVLEWSYGHVWHFLRLFQLPYCSLYDQGYTSLGTVKDTLPCPALAVPGFDQDDSTNNQNDDKDDDDDDNNGNTTSRLPRYWPAYMLRDYDQERAGRISKDAGDSAKKSKTKKSGGGSSTKSGPEDSSSSSLGNLSTMSEGRFLTRNKTTAPKDVEDSSSSSDSVISYSTKEFQKTVGVLIIGDEILKGLTVDTNTHAAARALRKHNVLLKRVSVVSDDLEEIVKEINLLRKQVDVLITSGGVGPTHDDVTIKSVAAALNCEMVLHEGMAELLLDKMGGHELTPGQVKMATLPCASKLRYLSDSEDDWPVLQCRNIFVLPGVPEFFASKIENVAEYLSCQLERSVAYKVVLSVEESTIVSDLNRVVENHPSVTIGSYPCVSHPDFKTVITVEGRLILGGRSNSTIFSRHTLPLSNKEVMDRHVQMALDELITTLPKGSVLRVANDDLLLFD